MHWYLARGEQQWGPFSDTDFKRLAREGRVDRSDLVWNTQMTDWTAASNIPGLLELPPPIAIPQPPAPAAPPTAALSTTAHTPALTASVSLDTPTPTTTAMVAYVLLLIFIFPLLPIIGIVVSLVNSGSEPAWLATHYRWQIRTFVLSLLTSIVGVVTLFVGVGFIILILGTILYILRLVTGISALNRREPIPNVKTWLW